MFDENDRLLYVGVSVQFPMRLSQHEGTKPWWQDVTKVTVEHFDLLDAALAAEGKAQVDEDPVRNVVRNGRVPNHRARRRQRDEEFQERIRRAEDERRQRGVYAIRVKCTNCFTRIAELPIGVALVDADCPNCGVNLAPEREAA
jgi:hypothetical protein